MTEERKTDPPPSYQGISVPTVSSALQEAMDTAAALYQDVKEDSYRYTVFIIGRDGTSLAFNKSYSISYNEDWLFVFTKFYGFYVFHKQDLVRYSQAESVTIPFVD